MLVLSHSDTHTTSMGIWDGAGATKSWLHSGTLKKVFCPDQKKSQLKRNFLSGWWEKRWTMTMRNELETLKKLFWWGKMCGAMQYRSLAVKVLFSCWISLNFVELPLKCMCFSISLFLNAKVDFDCVWFVVRNCQIPVENGNLLWDLNSWTAESCFPCELNYLQTQFTLFTVTLV